MTTLRFKRRLSGGAAGAPTTLATTEPAYNETDDILYLGYGDSGSGVATSIRAVAGAGAFVDKTTTQTVAGLKTFSTTPVVGTLTSTDNSTSAASTAFVKAQNYLLSNQTITLSGDVSGAGTTAITTALAATGITGGTYTKLTVDAKGRATAGTTLSAADIPTLTAVKISDFDTQVRTSRLDQMGAPTASVSLNSQKITNLLAPTADTDAANKAYVDNVAQGLDTKGSVKAATTINITLSNTQTIDAVAVAVGDRVLVKNQTLPSQNGIYVVAAGAWTRAEDANSWTEYISAFAFVEQGTANADTGWVCTVDAGGTLDTTAITFTQFSGGGSYTAGTGLTLTGTTFNVIGTADRITAAADSIDIASTYAGQTSIITLGTVSTGTWSGTAISAAKGGTGQTSYVIGNLLYASSTSALSKLTVGASGAVLTVAAGLPAWTSTVDGGTF
jgi:hypothetical protein